MANTLLPHFSNQLKYHRCKLRYRQADVARLTGIDRRRISKIELREKAATKEEAWLLARVLGFFCGETDIVSRLSPTKPLLPIQQLYIPPSDRPFQVRLNEARRQFPGLLQEIEEMVASRKDAQQVVAFLQDVPVDSSLEVIVLLKLLAAGAKNGYDSPGRYGYFGTPIIEPQYRTPIVGWRRPMFQLGRLAGFFQVCFEVSRVVRVDLLICHLPVDQATPNWMVVEIDGAGHKDVDDSRDKLPLPVIRFFEAEVLGGNFALRFIKRVGSSMPQIRAA